MYYSTVIARNAIFFNIMVFASSVRRTRRRPSRCRGPLSDAVGCKLQSIFEQIIHKRMCDYYWMYICFFLNKNVWKKCIQWRPSCLPISKRYQRIIWRVTIFVVTVYTIIKRKSRLNTWCLLIFTNLHIT